ncbi:MAG: tetratricopeptide repeat protein [Deltaproteobacteria bacterium]|nr:tetratricopeptide repeat protein [Deltaproteobacteria bacterium]
MKTSSLLLSLLLCLASSVGAQEVASPGAPSGEVRARKSVALNPAIAERLLRANALLEKDHTDDALDVIDELAGLRRLGPADVAQIHRFRGYILVSKGDSATAAQEFETSLAQNALDDAARLGMTYSLAQIYTQTGRYDRALELIDDWFETAERPKPDAYFLKAMILVQQEKFAEALAPARTAIENSAQDRESWLQLLAAIQFELHDYAAVASALQRLVVVAPKTKRYWVQLASIQNALDEDDEALATLGLAHRARLLDADREYRQLARLSFVNELPYRCAQTLEEGISTGVVTADADSYDLLANCYIAARETDRALQPLERAGELAPEGQSYLLLGQLHLQRDRFEPARVALTKALAKAKPDQRGSIELLLGIAQLGLDRFDDAERSFRAASGDDKIRSAAQSYLAHLEQQRARRDIGRGAGEDSATASAAPAAADEELSQ